MLTTPMVARFHNSALSNSATDTLKLVRRRSLRLRTTWRRSFSDCAASMLSSRVRKAIIQSLVVRYWSLAEVFRQRPTTKLGDHFGGNTLSDERFDHVANFDIAVIGDGD